MNLKEIPLTARGIGQSLLSGEGGLGDIVTQDCP
jgi:hypothetical protein